MEITIQSEAIDTRQPERATLTIMVSFESEDKTEPIRLTTEAIQQLQQHINAMKVMQPSPTTWSATLPISTRSWRPWNQDGKILPVRYAAQAIVKIKFKDFAALSQFSAAWGDQPGIKISSVEWTLTQPTKTSVENLVLQAAVTAARERAQTIATAAGCGKVRFVHIADPGMLTEKSSSQSQSYGAAARSSQIALSNAGSEGLLIEPEHIETTVKLDARFTA